MSRTPDRHPIRDNRQPAKPSQKPGKQPGQWVDALLRQIKDRRK